MKGVETFDLVKQHSVGLNCIGPFKLPPCEIIVQHPIEDISM